MSNTPDDSPPVEQWGPPADPPSPAWGSTPIAEATKPTRTGYHVPAPTARSKRVVAVLGLGIVLTLVGVAVIVGVLVAASGVSKRTNDLASCRAERAMLMRTNGDPPKPGTQLDYFSSPGTAGAPRINTDRVPRAICEDVPAPAPAPVEPGAPATPDSAGECTSERATLIAAWNAAKAANAADPKGPRQSYAYYLTNPTPTYFALPSAAGAARIATDRVPVSMCAEITPAELG